MNVIGTERVKGLIQNFQYFGLGLVGLGTWAND
jgi:hypothetical protein